MTNSSALWFAKFGATWRGRWAIAVLFSATSALISLIAFSAVISSINEKTLRTLDAQLLRRAELAVDYAFIALSELSEGGFSNCDSSSLAEFRKTIYRYGVIKDIRISNSFGIACSANSEMLNVVRQGVAFTKRADRPVSGGSTWRQRPRREMES
jgi:sensor c-di-GMP phosphodiesterase-like protein